MAEAAAVSSESDTNSHTEAPSTNLSQNSDNGRVSLLKRSMDKTIKKCLSAGSLSVFAKSFHVLQEKNPNALKNIHGQIMEQLHDNIQEELKLMFEEENIMELLNALDSHIKSAPQDKSSQAWRPSGRIEDDLLPHLIPVKRKQKEKLQAILTKLEKEEKSLTSDVLASRERLLNTHQTIQQHVQCLDECCRVLEKKNIEDLVQDVKVMKKESV